MLTELALEAVLHFAGNRILGDGLKFYEVDGTILFELRSQRGGLPGQYVCYIIPSEYKELKEIPRHCCILDVNMSFEQAGDVIIAGVKEFIRCLAAKDVKTFNPDGGELGLTNAF